MNRYRQSYFPSLVDDVPGYPGHYVDNIFAIARKGLSLNKRIEKAGFKKRAGVSVIEAVFLLMLWRWINVSSIAIFCRQSLSTGNKNPSLHAERGWMDDQK